MKQVLILSLFCLGNGINEMMQLTFSPVFAATQAAFGVSSEAVTALPTIYLFAFAPAALALALLRTQWGLRSCLVAGTLVQAAGAWLRFVACAIPNTPGAFTLLAVGQLLAALAQPVFTNLPAVLSTTWFAAETRALATVAATLANPIGNALGSVVPGLVVPSGATPSVAAAALAHITLAQALVCTLIALATWVFVDDAPQEPPSAAAALRRGCGEGEGKGVVGLDDALLLFSAVDAGGNEDGGDAAFVAASGSRTWKSALSVAWAALYADVRTLVRNNNFLRLLAGFGIGLGIFNALLSLLGQLLVPCGYTPAIAGAVGGLMLASGLFSAIAAGFALRSTGAFVPVLRLGIGAAAVGMVGFLCTLRPHGEVALLIAASLLGASAVPLQPLTLENAAESTFPIPEDTSASLLTGSGKLMGVVFVVALQPLVGANTCTSVVTPTAGVIGAAMVLSATCLLSFRADYRRREAEAQRSPR